MSWNYRVIDFGTHVALHEVYHDADGNPRSYTADAIEFVVDPSEGRAGVIASLRRALADAESPAKPTLTPADFPGSG